MVEHALKHGMDHLCFARIETDAEEHALRIRVFKRAAVSVQPWCEYDTARPRRHVFDDIRHVAVKAGSPLLVV